MSPAPSGRGVRQPSKDPGKIREMFGRVAPRYQLMNTLMSGGQDTRWRRVAVRRLSLPPGGRLLDLGAGTGDLSREVLRQAPAASVLSADFTLEMMRVGGARPGPRLAWCAADALRLPYPDASFDGVISGFLLRNVADLPLALREQHRVLKPGGRLVALDTTRPQPNLFSPLIRFHLRRVIPALGALITGQQAAYTYLPSSSESFLSAEELAACLSQAGFRSIGFERLMFATVAIHWGIK